MTEVEYLKKLYETIGRWAEIELEKYYNPYRYDDVLPAKGELLLVDIYGYGVLMETICSVTMPDATVPDIMFVAILDNKRIEDWTCEEYYSLIGFHPPYPNYGGYTIYDTTSKKYSWVTSWNTKFTENMKVYLVNNTDVEVAVDVWDVEFKGKITKHWVRV